MVRVLFVHPDLGIGGAERLVVDAALALKSRGHSVSILTNHHESSHCFEETRDGTLQVETVGDWLPRNVFGKLAAFCAYFRMIYAALYTAFFLSHQEKIDVIFCDQISLGIPILKWSKHSPKVIFYCHFPDQLLSKPGGLLKRCYRALLNYLEERTTGTADVLLVNSMFTRKIFKQTFKSLSHLDPDVLYPSLNTDYFDRTETEAVQLNVPENSFLFLSLNRYERKKNLPLAIRALAKLRKTLADTGFDQIHLVMAGGYDVRVAENVEHFRELEQLTEQLALGGNVTFLKSPSDAVKLALLRTVNCVIYTPKNEHFGIVPLEAMYMGRPVIAVNSGGPKETVVDRQTGYLCNPNPDSFHDAMLRVYQSKDSLSSLGESGRARVQRRFSFEAFTEKLDLILFQVLNGRSLLLGGRRAYQIADAQKEAGRLIDINSNKKSEN